MGCAESDTALLSTVRREEESETETPHRPDKTVSHSALLAVPHTGILIILARGTVKLFITEEKTYNG